MNSLKPALIVPSRKYRKVAQLVIGACIVFVLGDMNGFFRGMRVSAASEQHVQTETASTGCGISDPLGCAVLIAGRIGEMFDPAPAMLVITTPFSATTCADAERAYWACIDDEACPLEKLEVIADDVNICQTRH